jgi:ABC-type phosphate transport system ATPase subunit
VHQLRGTVTVIIVTHNMPAGGARVGPHRLHVAG